MPPYVIFHDSTLITMSENRPTTIEQMSQISEIGERKLEKYGEIFLKEIMKAVEG